MTPQIQDFTSFSSILLISLLPPHHWAGPSVWIYSMPRLLEHSFNLQCSLSIWHSDVCSTWFTKLHYFLTSYVFTFCTCEWQLRFLRVGIWYAFTALLAFGIMSILEALGTCLSDAFSILYLNYHSEFVTTAQFWVSANNPWSGKKHKVLSSSQRHTQGVRLSAQWLVWATKHFPLWKGH